MTGSRRTPAIAAQRMTALSRLARSRSSASRAPHPLHHRQRPGAAGAAARPHRGRDLLGGARQRGDDGRARGAGSRPTASCAPAPCATPASTRCGAASSTCSPPGLPQPGPPRLLRRHAGIDPRLRPRDPAHHRAAALARPRADERGAAHHRDDPALPPGLRRSISAPRPADDRLYEAVSEGRRYAGLEHWLPLFHEQLDTLFDYLAGRADGVRRAGRGRGRPSGSP